MTVPAYEKHSPTTDALDTLGSVITGTDQKRDAIHLAVEPAIAGQYLSAGQHVSFNPETSEAFVVPVGEGVGIVDPFLEEVVNPGDEFWLVVYPRQIASLRHVWEHPKFPPSRDLAEDAAASPNAKPEHILRREAAVEAEAVRQRAEQDAADAITNRVEAGEWLKTYLQDEFYIGEASEDGYYSTFAEIIEEATNNPDYLLIRGSDASGIVPDEFWKNLEIYVGHPVPHGEVYFACSC